MKYKLLLASLVGLIVLGLSGCSVYESDNTIESEGKINKVCLEDSSATEEKLSDSLDSLPSAKSPVVEDTVYNIESQINDDSYNFWESPVLVINNTYLDIPFSYSKIIDLGFDFPESDKCTLDAGEFLTNSVKLFNNKYDDRFEIRVSLTNNDGTKVKDFKDCNVSSISFNRFYANTTLVKNIPSISLGGKITWGSSYEDVVSFLGEPVYTYTSDNYSVYDFKGSDDSTYPKVTVTISKTYGVVGIELYTSL